MRMHPVISVFLAAWFTLSGTLIPRFSCLCADGTASVEIGQQFCCDVEDSCSDSCDSNSAGTVKEPRGFSISAWSCPGGCHSTLIEDEVIGTSERAFEGDLGEPPSMQAHWFDFKSSANVIARRVACVAKPPDLCRTSIHQLRSVILLV